MKCNKSVVVDVPAVVVVGGGGIVASKLMY